MDKDGNTQSIRKSPICTGKHVAESYSAYVVGLWGKGVYCILQ
jgi:hypothetical protein